MSGSRSRRRKHRTADAKRDAKPVGSRPSSASARRRSTPLATAAKHLKDAREADPNALRAEIRALKRALTVAEEKANEADAKRARSVARATATLRRENESLEAHLTLVVQEIGQVKHLIDRVPRLEADLRAKDLQLAEREQAWQAERGALQAEIERLSASPPRGAAGARSARTAAAGARSARAAAAAASARPAIETAR